MGRSWVPEGGGGVGGGFRRGVRGGAAAEGVAGATGAVLGEVQEGRSALRAFKQDPGSVSLAVALVECLPEEGRRTLAAVLQGEGYGWRAPSERAAVDIKEVLGSFGAIDANKDGVVTEAEFESYVARQVEEAREEGRPEWGQLASYMAMRGAPMVGFGFLDNAIMLVAGEGVELALGAALGLSTLAAAAIGNLFSDVVGLGAGGFIERYAERLGIPPHKLSPAQLRRVDVARYGMAASVLGISAGCVLGMTPLFFLPDIEVSHGR